MSNEVEKIKNTARKLDKVSPSFCLAKWTQSTIHLHNGYTHSCHHPTAHKVPVETLKNNPGALHNTLHKIELRREMMEGKRPSECSYCWKFEDTGQMSDRHFKSNMDWSLPEYDKILANPYDPNYAPQYLEISFSNVCNFKCAYCGPQFSSKWVEEIKQYGGYDKTSDNYNNLEYLKQIDAMPIPEREYNPYVDAFWEWWPNLYNNLKVFRITGGEPLLSNNTFKILEFLQQNPNPELELAVNTNLCVPEKLMDDFISRVQDLTENNKIKRFQLYASMDTSGIHAEYIRYGLCYDTWEKNITKTLNECSRIQIVVMCAYTLLSPFRFNTLLEFVRQTKQKFISSKRYWTSPIIMDISTVNYPRFVNITTAQSFTNGALENNYNFMLENQEQTHKPHLGFYDFEVEKMKRVQEVIKAPVSENYLKKQRSDFYNFIIEYDRRRKTDFLNTFPELSDFFAECEKNAKEKK